MVNGIFDENTSIAPAKFRTSSTTVYAGSLDEVNNMIITNGLLLYVNGSSGVYSGSGTQWTDLSIYNNNATLTNSPTYSSTTGGGSFNFNGTSQFASVTPALLNTTYTGKTVFVVCRMSSAGWTPGVAQYRAMFGTSTGTRNFNFYVYHTAANTYQLHFSVSGSATITTDVAIVPDTWMILAVTQDTTVTYYVNGVSVYSAAGQTLSQYAAGGNEAVARADNYWSGDIAVCSIYSRTLSSAEILNNYNAFASRVGLTTSKISDRQNSDGTLNVNTQFDEFTGAPVVDSSLQLWLDAGQTASYSGSGTTWTNLANVSANTTLVNSPTFDTQGWLVFNGTDQSANTGLPGATTFTTDSDFTICCWARFSAYKAAATSIGTLVGAFNYQGYGLYWNGTPTTYTFGSYMRYASTVSSRTSSAVSLNTWYLVTQVYSRSGNFHQLYLNDTLSGNTTSISGTFNSNLNTVSIGIASGAGSDGTPGGGTAGTPFLGNISQAMIYNRALTADEVTTNFNALRGRYGV